MTQIETVTGPKLPVFGPELPTTKLQKLQNLWTNHKVEILTGVVVGVVAATAIAAAIFFTGGTVLALGLAAGLGGAGTGALAAFAANRVIARKENKAATQIQSLVRGHIVRKAAKDKVVADKAIAAKALHNKRIGKAAVAFVATAVTAGLAYAGYRNFDTLSQAYTSYVAPRMPDAATFTNAWASVKARFTSVPVKV